MVSATAALAQGKTIQRPIEDFVSAQGTFCLPDGSGGCVLFVPPAANFFGWSNNTQDVPNQRSATSKVCASVDYAGIYNAYTNGLFGTTTDGTVIERPLADGRAEVTVQLQTKNALTWVIKGTKENACVYATDPLLFGHRLTDVLNGADAALGDSFLQVVFINPKPGDPLPDLMQLVVSPLNGQELRSISFHASANGTLLAAFGVPQGTPGKAQIAQTGILFKSPQFKGATADGFPAEYVNLNIIGQ
jgi:hypothetical protein